MKQAIVDFIHSLQNYHSDDVFNPYSDNCSVSDTLESAKIRSGNLKKYLAQCLELHLTEVWVGEALGYRGGRRTGLPFSDEKILPLYSSNYHQNFEKATFDQDTKERTASIIWKEIDQLNNPPILWNIFPFHPFNHDHEWSNRKPKQVELRETFGLFEDFLNLFHEENIRLFAIGRVAEITLMKQGYKISYIRHPSFGGAKIFRQEIKRLFGSEES